LRVEMFAGGFTVDAAEVSRGYAEQPQRIA